MDRSNSPKPTSRQELELLVEAGFVAHMRGIRRGLARNLPASSSLDPATPIAALLMYNFKTGERRELLLTDAEAIERAQELSDSAREVIGFSPVYYLCANGPYTGPLRVPDLTGIPKSLDEWRGMKIEVSDIPHTLELAASFGPDEAEQLDRTFEDVKLLALSMTLSMQHGFITPRYSSGEQYRGQPFSYKVGAVHKVMQPPSSAEIEYVSSAMRADAARPFVLALEDFYSQVSDRAKILVGWGHVESLFDAEGVNLLNKHEKRAIRKALNGMSEAELSSQKIERIMSTVGDLKDVGRSQRLADAIAKLGKVSLADALDKVRALASERGKLAHGDSVDPSNSTKHIDFIERVLWWKLESLRGPFPRQ